jgi:hypothetical protein
MASSPSSERGGRAPRGELAILRHVVYGGAGTAGLSSVLPMLQVSHRRELTFEPHWSKEELVRHPEPRELIRAMRKPGNLDAQGRPVYTLDERRSLTADIYENRVVRQTYEAVRGRVQALADDPDPRVSGEARAMLRVLEGARRQASFLDEVGEPGRTNLPTATLTQDPLYRRLMAIREELGETG